MEGRALAETTLRGNAERQGPTSEDASHTPYSLHPHATRGGLHVKLNGPMTVSTSVTAQYSSCSPE